MFFGLTVDTAHLMSFTHPSMHTPPIRIKNALSFTAGRLKGGKPLEVFFTCDIIEDNIFDKNFSVQVIDTAICTFFIVSLTKHPMGHQVLYGGYDNEQFSASAGFIHSPDIGWLFPLASCNLHLGEPVDINAKGKPPIGVFMQVRSAKPAESYSLADLGTRKAVGKTTQRVPNLYVYSQTAGKFMLYKNAYTDMQYYMHKAPIFPAM